MRHLRLHWLGYFAMQGSLLPGWIGVEFHVLGLLAETILLLKQRFWLMSSKRACRSRSRTPPELTRVQCESSNDDDSETGSCSRSSLSSESGSSTSSASSTSSTSTGQSPYQSRYDAAEQELLLVSKKWYAGGRGCSLLFFGFFWGLQQCCCLFCSFQVGRDSCISGIYSWGLQLRFLPCRSRSSLVGGVEWHFLQVAWPVLSMFEYVWFSLFFQRFDLGCCAFSIYGMFCVPN